MAEQYSDLEQRGSIRAKLNEAIRQLNSSRRDWFSTFDGPRCYHNGKSWDLATNGQPTAEPGSGSDWNEVGSSAPGTVTIAAFTTPSGNQITNAQTSFGWTVDSQKTYQSYQINVYDDGAIIYNAAGNAQAHTVSGIPLDGSNIRVDVILTYSDATTDNLTRTFTTSAGTAPATWTSPVNGAQVDGGSLTAQWAYGTKSPQNWTLTVTNQSAASQINVYTGTTAASQVVAGLPDDGSSVLLSLAITFTDSTSQTLTSTITNGVAVSAPEVTLTAVGATVSGEIVVSGAIARWASSAATADGNQQTNFNAGTGQVTIADQGGTITEVKFPNAGISSLAIDNTVQPTYIDLDDNPQLSIPAGDINFTGATHINIRNTGAGTLLRDSDIPNPSGIVYLDLCNAPGATVTGQVIGQMTSNTYLCLQAIGISLTDAHMSAANYAAMKFFLCGYNNNVNITTATTDKMPNLEQFHVPYSATQVVGAMFQNKPSLTNIDINGNTINSQGDADGILQAIRANITANGLTGGLLKMLVDNPAPTNGASNADLVFIQSQGWTVT